MGPARLGAGDDDERRLGGGSPGGQYHRRRRRRDRPDLRRHRPRPRSGEGGAGDRKLGRGRLRDPLRVSLRLPLCRQDDRDALDRRPHGRRRPVHRHPVRAFALQPRHFQARQGKHLRRARPLARLRLRAVARRPSHQPRLSRLQLGPAGEGPAEMGALGQDHAPDRARRGLDHHPDPRKIPRSQGPRQEGHRR